MFTTHYDYYKTTVDNDLDIAWFYHHRMLQPQAKEKAKKEKFKISVAKTSFKANTKALAENEGEGLAKVVFVNAFLFIYFLNN